MQKLIKVLLPGLLVAGMCACNGNNDEEIVNMPPENVFETLKDKGYVFEKTKDNRIVGKKESDFDIYLYSNEAGTSICFEKENKNYCITKNNENKYIKTVHIGNNCVVDLDTVDTLDADKINTDGKYVCGASNMIEAESHIKETSKSVNELKIRDNDLISFAEWYIKTNTDLYNKFTDYDRIVRVSQFIKEKSNKKESNGNDDKTEENSTNTNEVKTEISSTETNNVDASDNKTNETDSNESSNEIKTKEESKPSANTTSKPNTQTTTKPQDTISTGKKNALQAAEQYLNTMPFSYNGLIEQLKYSGYSEDEAKYGADNCGANWKNQAVSKAKTYLSTMPFSYNGLIEQLQYDNYTTEEATYAADNCGADWNEQAANKAKDYMNIMSFSKQELIDQLVYDGYTQSQAEYGVSQAGY